MLAAMRILVIEDNRMLAGFIAQSPVDMVTFVTQDVTQPTERLGLGPGCQAGGG